MKIFLHSIAIVAAACVIGTVLTSAGAPTGAGVAKTDLPLKQVVLFTSGVAYFERAAEISGTAALVYPEPV